MLLLAFAAFGAAFVPPFGSCGRLSSEPIRSPRGSGFESAGTFNLAVVKENGWEKVGQVPSVVLVEGLVRELAVVFYYGGADKYVGGRSRSSSGERRPLKPIICPGREDSHAQCPRQCDVARARQILGDFGMLNAGLTLKDAAF